MGVREKPPGRLRAQHNEKLWFGFAPKIAEVIMHGLARTEIGDHWPGPTAAEFVALARMQ